MNNIAHITPSIEGVYPLSEKITNLVYDQLTLIGAPEHGRHAFHLCYQGLCSEFSFTGQYGKTVFISTVSGFVILADSDIKNELLDGIRPALAQLHKQHMQMHAA